jgi:serine/threonine-protein kinase HipA
MAESRVQVYVQLPDDDQKTLAGEFSWDSVTRVGAFAYAKEYLGLKGAYLLDPTVLTRAPRKEVRNDGIYGVLRDAGPDAWGRDQLARLHGSLDEIDLLQQAPQDGAGNITFHPEQRLRAYSLREIDEVSSGFPPPDSVISSVLNQTTSMGGAKPKLLLMTMALSGSPSFEKGDPECRNAANEHAMLCHGGAVQTDAAESRVHQLPDGRLILLVKRFDLAGTPERFTRLGFASAHTVLGMGDVRKDGALKSYPLLRYQARRWTRKEIGPALWRRLAFNALVSNIDDHPRNHALVYDGEWSLSKAFDIVARPVRDHRLCLQIHSGSVIATPESLLVSADEMGWSAKRLSPPYVPWHR